MCYILTCGKGIKIENYDVKCCVMVALILKIVRDIASARSLKGSLNFDSYRNRRSNHLMISRNYLLTFWFFRLKNIIFVILRIKIL